MPPEQKKPGQQSTMLQKEARRLLRMVEHLPAGAVYRENNCLFMNRAAEVITGYGRDELATLDLWFNRLYGEYAEKIRQHYRMEREAGFPRQYGPIAHRRKDGEQRYVEYAAYKFDDHEVWILHDVTKRYESEAAFHERQERLFAVMDNVAEAIVVIGNDGVVTDFNNAAVKLFGYTTNEVIGHNVNLLMPSPYREAHDGYLAHYLKTREARIMNQQRELPGRHKDGSILPLELTVTRVDHLGVYIGIIRDLRRQKMLEKEIADISTREQEHIGQEIHDGLGQQLTGLSMMAASIKRHLAAENSAQAEQLDEMIKQLQQAIKEARVLSRGLVPVPVTPEGLRDALTMLANDVNANMGIDCFFDASDSVNIKDRTSAIQIYRIAQEAVNNAVKYANASKINIKLNTQADVCELAISDNGCGFQMDDQSADGNGMGLRIMRYRAGIIGGNLTIKTSPGKGTVVSCKHAIISLRK